MTTIDRASISKFLDAMTATEREVYARNSTDPVVLDLLAHDYANDAVRGAVALNAATSVDTLRELAISRSPDSSLGAIRASVGRNKNTPLDVLIEMVNSRDGCNSHNQESRAIAVERLADAVYAMADLGLTSETFQESLDGEPVEILAHPEEDRIASTVNEIVELAKSHNLELDAPENPWHVIRERLGCPIVVIRDNALPASDDPPF